MAQSERVILKKIYVGKAALFGLYIGIILGILFGIFIFIGTLLSLNFVSDITKTAGQEAAATDLESASIGGALVVAFLSFILTIIATPILCALGALIYNLIAKFGAMQFEFGEYEAPYRQNYQQNYV